MRHPPPQDLLAFAAEEAVAVEVTEHLRRCTDCRRMVALGAGEDTPAVEAMAPEGLPVVDRSLYAQREALEGGDGGMGRIFTAVDQRLGRKVALKEPRSLGAEEPSMRAALRQRFVVEARLTARLQHPAIVPVYEAGRWEDGTPFYTMPRIDGTPLDREIDRRAALVERLALLQNVTTVAEAVAYAHDRGVLHRDIKPANILLGAFGETVLIDWGLGKELTDASLAAPAPDGVPRSQQLTALGVGTPNYMSPEQARGDAPDARMDLYALGATLYHLLVGRAPYWELPPSEVRRALLQGPPRALDDRELALPRDLVTLVARAMARDPAQRFASALDLAVELRRIQAGQLTRSHRYSPGELLRHYLRRYRGVARVLAAAVLVLAAVGAVSVRRVVRERNRADRSRALAERSARSAEMELQRARGALASYFATRPERRIHGVEYGILAVGPSLQRGREPPAEASRGLLDALSSGRPMVPLGAPSSEVMSLAFAPDGSFVATLNSDGTVRTFDGQTGRPRTEQETRLHQPQRLVVSPDGARLLAWGVDDEMDLMNAHDRGVLRIVMANRVAGAVFAEGGATVVGAGFDGTVTAWDVATGTALGSLTLGEQATAVFASPGGRVGVGGGRGAVLVWDRRAGTVLRLRGNGREVTCGAFTAGDARVFVGTTDGTVLGWRAGEAAAPAPELTWQLPEPDVACLTAAPRGERVVVVPRSLSASYLYDPARATPWRRLEGVACQRAFSPDGAHLLLSRRDGAVAIRDLVSDRELGSFDGHRSLAYVSVFSPDGARVASSARGDPVLLWGARLGRAAGMLARHDSEVVSLAILSPSRMVTASLDGTVRVWDLGLGTIVSEARLGGEVLHLAVSPDGSRLLAATASGEARLLSADGSAVSDLPGHSGPVVHAAFSPRGDLAATASLDGSARVWDARSGQLLRALRAPHGAVVTASFAAGGEHLATVHADGAVTLWDARSGGVRWQRTFPDRLRRMPIGAHAAPDGRLLAVALSTGETELWTLPGGVLLRSLEGTFASTRESPFLLGGRRVVTVLGDGRVLLWDIDGAGRRELLGHTRRVLSATTSHDGRRLVTAGVDGTVRLWDLAGATLLQVVERFDGDEVTAARLSPDGRDLVVARGNGLLRLYPASLPSALARGCEALQDFGRADAVAPYCP